MSRAQRRTTRKRSAGAQPAAASAPPPRDAGPLFGRAALLVLTLAAFAAASVGGGMLGDRALPGPTGGAPELWGFPVSVYGVPLALVLAAMGLRAASRRAAWSALPRGAAIVFLALTAWCLVSLFGSSYLNAGLLHLGILALALALGALTSHHAGTPRAALALCAGMAMVAGLVAMVGVAEYIEQWEAGNGSWRVFGPFVNPSFLAGYLLLTGPMSAGALLALSARPLAPGARWAPYVIGTAAVVCLAGLLTASLGVGAVSARVPGIAGAAVGLVGRLALAAVAGAGVVLLSRLRDPAVIAQRLLSAAVALAVAAQAACFLLTQSRTGLLAAVLGLTAMVALLLWSRALGRPRRSAILAAAIVLAVPLLIGARPLLHRLQASAGQGYSAQFRVYTWRGTVRMAAANPLKGTGLGTFETAYPRYAVVDYTQHAHNSFLQLAGEAGVPALCLLVAGLLIAMGAGVRAALRGREHAGDADAPIAASLLAAGAVGALVASAVHNVFDSAYYVPACAAALGAAAGLALGVGRRSTETDPPPVAWQSAMRLAVGAAGLVMAIRGVQMGVARSRMAAAEAAVSGPSASVSQGIAALREASGLEPRNPEYLLRLASFLEADDRPGSALQACRIAAAVARTGETRYRVAQLLGRMGRWAEAEKWHLLARECEPRNLQNLLALAEAHREAGHAGQAEEVYRLVADLRHTAFGRIRALPEIVDWEFGFAAAEVGESALARGDAAQARARFDGAAEVFAEFWRTRDQEMTRLRLRPDVRRRVTDRYVAVLARQAELAEARGDAGAARAARERMATVERERAEDEAAGQESGQAEGRN